MSMTAAPRPLRILVIDDDEGAWLAIREFLAGITEFECIAQRASTYEDSVRHFEGHAPDVCLLDYHLAEHDGIALLKRALEGDSRFPVVVVSDQDSAGAAVAAMQAGATNYLLRKDLSSATLSSVIAAALPPERRVDPERLPDFLGPGDQLFEYRIEKVLGHGGFGITYLARDTLLDARVAIKEYLPRELAYRATNTHVTVRSPADNNAFQWGLKQFLKEAQTLARFAHPNLVRVRRFFEAKATAYIVMEYAHGETLSTMLKREGTLSEERIRAVLEPLLDALERVHAEGILHRDIKPDNIILAEGQPLLIDFGAARVQLGNKTQSAMALFSAGYTPVEQYSSGGEQGPWTDIYALGGLAYRCITGRRPNDAVDRVRDDTMAPASQAGQGRYSVAFLEAVDWALQVHADDRPRSIAEWRSGFTAPKAVTAPSRPADIASPSAVTTAPPRMPAPAARRLWAWGAGAAAVLAASATVWMWSYIFGRQAATAEQAGVSVTAPETAPDAAPVTDKAGTAAKPSQAESRERATGIAAMEALSTFRDCPNCPEMRVVPAGAFSMGGVGANALPSELPVHPVAIAKPFAIGRAEVTVGEWGECVRAKACPARNPGAATKLPVVRVSWHEAQRYVKWLARHTGRAYRLPSEAAWEYAARSGIETGTFWGDKPDQQCRYANGADENSKLDGEVAECDDGYARLAPVGSFRPNYYDLQDMLGNASEWTEDCWRDSYIGAPADGSAVADLPCAQRVARGGSWRSLPGELLASTRTAHPPNYQADTLGFRVAAY